MHVRAVVGMSPNPHRDMDLALAREMASHFAACDRVLGLEPLGGGLINATFALDAPGGRFVLQRINPAVFPDASLIMDNLARLQEAARAAGASAPRLPRIFPAASGALCSRDEHGHAWRLLERVENAFPLARLSDSAQAGAIGRLLARFHRFGASLPVADFHVTLPRSHDTLGYRAELDAALSEMRGASEPRAGSEAGRAKARMDADLAAVIEQVRARDSTLGVVRAARDAGLARPTLVHGDPKRDNVLFDSEGRQAICLIDLDTVQPGLILHDIGDCLRSCCNRAGESARPGQVRFDAELAEALLRGYAEAAPGLLDPAEIALLFDAMRLIPLELGIRFLVDHLRGDRYFRVRYAGENLDKAKAQLALVADIERQEDRLRALGDCFAAASGRC